MCDVPPDLHYGIVFFRLFVIEPVGFFGTNVFLANNSYNLFLLEQSRIDYSNTCSNSVGF